MTSCVRSWAQLSHRYISSVLYISDRSTKIRPVLTPTLNLSEKFENIKKLQENIKNRGMDADAPGLKSLWELYTGLNETRAVLERRRQEIASQMRDLKEVDGKEAEEESEKFRLEGRTVREDLKKLLQVFWEVEERMMMSCLALPNDLHSRTPLTEEQIIVSCTKSRGEKPLVEHLVAGKDLIEFRDPHWYYLKKDAAVFDLALMNFFKAGLKSFGFQPMSNPDFAHSAVVEGCGTSPENYISIHPASNNFHLVGGASVFPFCAYYARQKIPESYLPVRHVAAGRKYVPSDGPGLLGSWQQNAVDIFTLTAESSDLEIQWNCTVENIVRLYDNLGWDFRVVLTPARKLKPWESLRASFQMISLNGYVEVGSLILSGTYMSERFPLTFEDKTRSKKFCQVLSGTAVNVTLVLACLLEQSLPLIPPALAPYTFRTVQ